MTYLFLDYAFYNRFQIKSHILTDKSSIFQLLQTQINIY